MRICLQYRCLITEDKLTKTSHSKQCTRISWQHLRHIEAHQGRYIPHDMRAHPHKNTKRRFEIIHSRDMARDANQASSWYVPMTPSWNPFTQRFQFNFLGMFLTKWGLKLCEVSTHSMWCSMSCDYFSFSVFFVRIYACVLICVCMYKYMLMFFIYMCPCMCEPCIYVYIYIYIYILMDVGMMYTHTLPKIAFMYVYTRLHTPIFCVYMATHLSYGLLHFYRICHVHSQKSPSGSSSSFTLFQHLVRGYHHTSTVTNKHLFHFHSIVYLTQASAVGPRT